MHSLESIKSELEAQFPEMAFSMGRRIYGKCIVANKSKYRGADIFLSRNGIVIDPAIPEMKTRLLIGAGAVFLRYFKKDFCVPAQEIKAFLETKHRNVQIRP